MKSETIIKIQIDCSIKDLAQYTEPSFWELLERVQGEGDDSGPLRKMSIYFEDGDGQNGMSLSAFEERRREIRRSG